MITATRNDRVIWVADTVEQALARLGLYSVHRKHAIWALNVLGEHVHGGILLTRVITNDKMELVKQPDFE